MNKLLKQILEKMDRIQESLDAIKNDVATLKDKDNIIRKPINAPITQVNQSTPMENPLKNYAVWNKYPEQYKKLLAITGGISFNAWFGEVKCIDVKESVAYISVPDQFHKEIIKARYTDDIKTVFEVDEVEISTSNNLYRNQT